MKNKNHQTDSQFDFPGFEEDVISKLKSGHEINTILKPLIKSILEKALDTELDYHLGHTSNNRSSSGNHRNGKTNKQLKTSYGSLELETPRDRNSTFEPQIVKKRQTTLGDSLDNKIISLYGLGLSYTDISSHIYELYGVVVSPSMLTSITDKILPVLTEWQSRPLDDVYPFVWLDAMFFKVREDGKISSKALYVVIGVNQEGLKDVLGIYTCESEGANFWLSVLTDLSNRGVEDILIACIDNLKGFSQAIESMFPKAEVQLCIIHQIRNSLKYIASKNQKVFMRDLKLVYQASNIEVAEQRLLELGEKWEKKYPVVIKSWNANWERLSNYFKYPKEIRKIIYTTNIIEGFNRQIRKVTKTKGAFTNETALMKLVFLVMQNITDKWTQPIPNWSLTISQLSIIFEDRLKLDLKT